MLFLAPLNRSDFLLIELQFINYENYRAEHLTINRPFSQCMIKGIDFDDVTGNLSNINSSSYPSVWGQHKKSFSCKLGSHSSKNDLSQEFQFI